jgi:peptidylprolyl isomerase
MYKKVNYLSKRSKMRNSQVTHACKVMAVAVGCILSGCNAQKPEPAAKADIAVNKSTPSNPEHKAMQPQTPQLVREVIKEAPANAVSPTRGQMVKVHYTGWLEVKDANGVSTNGKKFDSSVDRNDPFVFPLGLGYVIKGWDQGVAQMKVGEKAMLIIPADLGYGARGAGAAIPPNATLRFEVELLGIEG